MMEEDESEREVEYGTLAEQLDESHYDNRRDADNDLEKGRIRFPYNRLYGREKELMELHKMFSSLSSEDNDSSRVVFLGGYSGTGKSSLVEEFIKQISVKRSDFKSLQFMSGKFSQMSAGDPFSAVAQAMNQFVLSLTNESTAEHLKRVKKELAKVDISPGTDFFAVLEALIQDLEYLFQQLFADPQQDPSNVTSTKVKRSSLGQDLNMIKYAFQNFVKALAKVDPVVMFIDDLQWADDASLQLLLGLLKDKSVSRLLFIGAYRANEVDQGHKLTTVMKELEDDQGCDRIKKIEISNLSPKSITEFIADSIGKSVEEVKPVSDVVYTKTLGNIFFVKQAMEELVRRNAIYYDVVSYEWLYGDVSRVQLEKFLSDDVIEMVLSKLRALPELLQKALAVAAYANDIIELGLLMDLLKATSSETDHHSLVQMMELAYIEGLVLHVGANIPAAAGKTRRYKFAHDRILEASCASIPSGDVRDQFLIAISKVLQEHGSSSQDDDWMLFKAATYLNSLTPSLTDQIQLAELNLRVGSIASSKGAFNEAAVFLRAGVGCLDPSVGWSDNYTLYLELKNKLMETECFLGSIDKALELADEIFRNAKNLTDKSRAHFCYIEASNTKSNMDHARSASAVLDILELYGISIPQKPTKRQVKLEKIRLKLSLRGRSLFCLTKLPIATDPRMIATLRVATNALRFASLGGRTELSDLVAHRMLRFSLSEGLITKEMPTILSVLASKYRGQEKYNKSIMVLYVAINILERFPDEKGLEFLLSKFLVTAVISLRAPFRDSIDPLMDLHKLLLAKGDSFYSMAAALNGTLGYLNSSLRLNVIFESKLTKLDELASNVGRKSFAVIFRLLRQCVYNLQGGPKASSNPVEVKGSTYDEDIVQGSLEGVARKMNNRDISSIRLMLAVFFDDASCMEQMLDRLDEYPIFDLSIQRQHLRMVYTGFAALILARKSDKYQTWGRTSLDFFRKLAESGSENAQPVFACMKALANPSIKSFDDAIQICGNAGLFNLAALMNEKCGLLLLQDDKQKRGQLSGEDYLKCAFWMYHDWGAVSKCSQLQSSYAFLRSAMTEKVPSQLHEFRRVFAAQLPSSTDQLSEMKSSISGVYGISGN